MYRPTCKFSCLFVLRYSSSTGRKSKKEEEEEEEHGNSVKIEITRLTPVFRAFLDFSDIISFQHAPHFCNGIDLSGI